MMSSEIPSVGTAVFWATDDGIARGVVQSHESDCETGEFRCLKIESLYYRRGGQDIGSPIGTTFLAMPSDVLLEEPN
ncbi:hypothetical protein BiPBO1_31 [Brucella phage BiPBO1]|uniref:hypothetical protein n=1 Tax=Brucella phage BiPBO1 TaxID=1718278 RepID=UPI00046D1F7B|nr:hypothetical protein BJD47_gp31 [Brucella phage BiPBO1]ALJ98245.1 hypothetical protein BiPBO1_31 [Brucella phage BiPBO1]KEY03707.1 hypothetical protein IL59_0214970 [Brucella suis bv. 4 str. 40]